ncbi:hypothetical protein CEXT_509571 [Caerostris extrusa]|uniref:Uncharacterized protein n=1 Tax=Caerostris extrusa TaxID=172846 RepID=A0AAV4Y449_CAEEX|nr:hypothetical protein CEXT_509571 [Caerostris extrusa]
MCSSVSPSIAGVCFALSSLVVICHVDIVRVRSRCRASLGCVIYDQRRRWRKDLQLNLQCSSDSFYRNQKNVRDQLIMNFRLGPQGPGEEPAPSALTIHFKHRRTRQERAKAHSGKDLGWVNLERKWFAF